MVDYYQYIIEEVTIETFILLLLIGIGMVFYLDTLDQVSKERATNMDPVYKLEAIAVNVVGFERDEIIVPIREEILRLIRLSLHITPFNE